MKQRARVMHSGNDLISYGMTKKTDGDVHGEIPLFKMKPQEHFIEAQVQEGDTLQAIALRFYCSISELKRINHIHKDNEIFARRVIKVPVTPYSVLTEVLPGQQVEPVASTSSGISASPAIPELLNNTPGENPVQNSNAKDFSIECNEVVLNSCIAPAVIPYTDMEPADLASEDTQLLPPKQKEPIETVVVKELTSHGADFGLKWFHLFGFLLILCVLTPIIYVIYFVPHDPHSTPISTTTTNATQTGR